MCARRVHMLNSVRTLSSTINSTYKGHVICDIQPNPSLESTPLFVALLSNKADDGIRAPGCPVNRSIKFNCMTTDFAAVRTIAQCLNALSNSATPISFVRLAIDSLLEHSRTAATRSVPSRICIYLTLPGFYTFTGESRTTMST